MTDYEPIDPGVPIQASMSDLVAFRWETNSIEADFIVPSDKAHLISVRFDSQCIVRLLDEFPLSTEDNGGINTGLVPEHFAYRVRNAVFERMQSVAWRETRGDPKHYQFVTGWACMDVISSSEPSFKLISRPKAD
jgi:hypothetical protein